ncbi:MAG TPA: hypothetical protein VMY76_08565 [Gemmatimonadales bacterium]|nr:hypothetical protein [Gemmatimonadales bacterium]
MSGHRLRTRRTVGRLLVAGAALVLGIGPSGCRESTGAITATQQQRLDAEGGIVRRADDLVFRYTHDAGRRDAGWEDRRASIVVTPKSVIIHKNEKLGLEINQRTRRFVQVRRDGQRVRISAGSGSAAESWSFVPPDDAAGWVEAIRAVVAAGGNVREGGGK